MTLVTFEQFVDVLLSENHRSERREDFVEMLLKRSKSSSTQEEKFADVVVFPSAASRRSSGEIWDTAFFFSFVFELFDDVTRRSSDETRRTAFLLDRLNEIQLSSPVPIRLSVETLKYFRDVRLKLLVFLELLNFSVPIDCESATIFLGEFETFGPLTLFYLVDRLKFALTDKGTHWKRLVEKFSTLDDQKHVAFILFDQNNFYKINRASIRFGSKTFDRAF